LPSAFIGPVMPSHRHKLARANSHIKDIETFMAHWSSYGYRVLEQTNSKGRIDAVAEQLQPLPDEVPLIIGDALQCLRNSLDHIIFALSLPNPLLTPDKEHIPQFPIEDLAIKLGRYRIQFLSPAAQQAVCDLAPDKARQPLNQDPLWLLNKMNNRDKHREILVTAAASGVQQFVLSASDGTDYFHIISPQRMELGALSMPFMEFTRSPGVNAQITHSALVLFDKGVEVADEYVVPTLRRWHDHIRDTVFQTLEKYL
jgi:hypothetical protein